MLWIVKILKNFLSSVFCPLATDQQGIFSDRSLKNRQKNAFVLIPLEQGIFSDLYEENIMSLNQCLNPFGTGHIFRLSLNVGDAGMTVLIPLEQGIFSDVAQLLAKGYVQS